MPPAKTPQAALYLRQYESVSRRLAAAQQLEQMNIEGAFGRLNLVMQQLSCRPFRSQLWCSLEIRCRYSGPIPLYIERERGPACDQFRLLFFLL